MGISKKSIAWTEQDQSGNVVDDAYSDNAQNDTLKINGTDKDPISDECVATDEKEKQDGEVSSVQNFETLNFATFDLRCWYCWSVSWPTIGNGKWACLLREIWTRRGIGNIAVPE